MEFRVEDLSEDRSVGLVLLTSILLLRNLNFQGNLVGEITHLRFVTLVIIEDPRIDTNAPHFQTLIENILH